MTQRRMFRPTLVATALLAAGLLAGCGNDSGDEHDGMDMSSAPMTSAMTTGPSATEDADDTVTPQAAQQLCDMIGTELDTWRDQGSVAARVSFNGTVQNWAARNEGLNDEVLQDKTMIDTVTTQTCPDVRTQALEVLDTDDLASALVGFGG